MPASERFEFPDVRANAPRDEDFAAERLSREGNWSPNFSGRTSARIFASFFDWDRLIQTVDRSHFPQKRWSDLL
ncbi:hypothetical protein [Thioclava sp. ES.031]|uniref:hypothetical protein n=1 Tax=Thioclava sp. ES.031 TaxID=1798203 RepID=UPI0011461067|nr:hypothetical protein [Thioclava sp. ES.031]